MGKPLVSIACLTYNHEKYIKDAIEGFLSQKTEFDYEILIHDDASTDRTADIIRRYEIKYPNKIYGIYQRENQLSKIIEDGNMLQDYLYPVCKGKYIALCEGDDFWIDPDKLQMQVNYLESHPECAAVCHDAVCIDCRDATIYPIHPYFGEKYLTNEEVIIQYRGDVPTASMMYRRDAICMDKFFMQGGSGDYAHELYAITKGKIYFSSRIMSVYRAMHEGSWTMTHSSDIEKGIMLRGKVLNFLRRYDAYTKGEYHHAIVYKESLFVLDSIYLCRNLDVYEIENIIRRCNVQTENQYKEFLTRMEMAYKQMYVEEYYPALMKTFAEKYSRIYIWGAGKFGQRVARQLLNHSKDFEAFIVSEPSGQKVMGKPVVGLDEVPYPAEDVGIIIAVNIQNWDEIRGYFEKNGEFHYIYPYGVTEIM